MTVAAGGITAAALRADIIAGRNAGAWNGTGGILSGAAAASNGTRTVGYVVAGDGSARVSFAAPGDTNLDGSVDLLDLLEVLGSGSYDSGVASVWNQGDFNYDGRSDLLDLLAILGSNTYDQGSYFPLTPAGSMVAVPEPSIPGWIALAFASLVGLKNSQLIPRRFRHPVGRPGRIHHDPHLHARHVGPL